MSRTHNAMRLHSTPSAPEVGATFGGRHGELALSSPHSAGSRPGGGVASRCPVFCILEVVMNFNCEPFACYGSNVVSIKIS